MDRDAAAPAGAGPRGRLVGLFAVIASMTAIAMLYGYTGQLLSVVLDDRGVRGSLIGLSGAAQMTGVFLAIPVLPWLIRRMGPARLMLAGAALALAAIAAMALAVDVWFWFPLRFALGAAQATMWTTGETWVNHACDDRRRGRTVSVYMSAVAAGYAAGPFVLAEVGSQGAAPFAAAAAMVVAVMLPLLAGLGDRIAAEGRPSARLHQYVRLAPVPMVSNLLFGAIGGAFMALFAVYGLRLAMDEAGATRMLGWMGWGGVLMPLLIAWFAERIDRTLLLAFFVALGAVATAGLPWIGVMNPWLLVAYLMVFGGLRSAHYGIAVMLVGDRFRGADLPSATAVFGLMFGTGSILGPALGGIAIDLWDPHGLVAAILLFHLVLLPLPLAAWRRRGRPAGR